MSDPSLFQTSPWQGLAEATRQRLLDAATTVHVQNRAYIARQHYPAEHFALLRRGEVDVFMEGQERETLWTGRVRQAMIPLGWSGFHPPYRYAASLRAAGRCELLRWSFTDLDALCRDDPDLGRRLMAQSLEAGQVLLLQARDLLRELPAPAPVPTRRHEDDDGEALTPDRLALGELLRRSPFFEVFDEALLGELASLAVERRYRTGEQVFAQDGPVQGLWLLGSGCLSLDVRLEAGEVCIRRVTQPGQVADWAGLPERRCHVFQGEALRDSTLYLLPVEALQCFCDRAPAWGMALGRRLLWQLGNQLRALRVQAISRRADHEIPAVRHLLAQAGPRLSVGSDLHKVPHLLTDRLTLGDGFGCLKRLNRQGDAVERGLAGLCLDLLGETRREWLFFQGLRDIYRQVVEAPPDTPCESVRLACSQSFARLFGTLPHRMGGLAHLPRQPGQIFILNHLANHPYNTLPNGFQLTLDAHFVSSMILLPRYQDPGVRVVRRSRGEEYGHQYYYDRLGHIYVYTNESNPPPVADRGRFFEVAADHLRAGRNLVLCPEGTSRPQRESPGPFKPGAFRLALAMEPEPWVVPVAVAHFDRRVNRTTLTALVKPPFKVSELVNQQDPRSLAVFLEDLRHAFRSWVREADALADREVSSD